MGSDPISAGIRARLESLPADAAICVGFSGGLDSTVLLHLLARDAERDARRVTALHVHHGLSPHADDWARACERFCANQGVPLAVERVRVDPGSPLGLEGAARMARHAAYAARPEPLIALAHHLDDQAETVLFQLLRGTGLKGMAAMPQLRALAVPGKRLFRPLLAYPRASLEAYARAEGLRWVEDESNASSRFDRNYLRLEVAPLLGARFPGWQESLARFARHAGAAGELLDALAHLDGVPDQPGEALPLRAELDEARRANALRAWLGRNAVAMPSEARLAEMSRQLWDAREDARVRIEHGGITLVRHREGARIERGVPPAASDADWEQAWRGERELDLGGERGHVAFDATPGQGIRASLAGEGWCFRSRRGGETIRLAPDRPTRTLKNLLREREVPEWQRDHVPLLFHHGRLVWVPGVGIDADHACGGGEAGLSPCWRVAGKAPLC